MKIMREILFRGKVDDTKKWIMGDLISHTYEKPNIRSIGSLSSYIVIPETVGQYTGKTDKNGTKIFEGDIIKGTDLFNDTKIFEMAWNGGADCWGAKLYVLDDSFPDFLQEQGFVFSGGLLMYSDIEIIGNIHDNPELLGGATNV